MIPRSLLITSLLLSAATALQSVGARPRRSSGPARLHRSSPLYHVEAEPTVRTEDYPESGDEKTNWNTTKRNNSKKKLQDLINNLKEKCSINLSGTFNNVASLIRVLKKLEAEELVACNISKNAANLTGNHFLISAEDLNTELVDELPIEAKRVPEIEFIELPSPAAEQSTKMLKGPALEICEESTTVPELSVTKQRLHEIPAIGFVSPGMEIAMRKTTTSTVAPVPVPELSFTKQQSHEIPAIGFVSPGMEIAMRKTTTSTVAPVPVPELSFTKQQSHEIPAIGFVSPGMEIAMRKTTTSTVAPVPDLGFISPDMTTHEIEYHSGKSTAATLPGFFPRDISVSIPGSDAASQYTQEVLQMLEIQSNTHNVLEEHSCSDYEETLLSEPDEKKIQTVLQNFQQATKEDQQQQRSQRRGRKMSKRHEFSDDFMEDQRIEDLIPSRSLSEFDIDDQETMEENDDNNEDIVEEKLDELEANLIPDARENKEFEQVAHDPDQSDSSEEAFDELVEQLDTPHNNDQNEGSNAHKYSDEELVQNSIDKLHSDQLHEKQIAPNPSADELDIMTEDENDGNTVFHEEMTNNNPKTTHNKQSVRDTVEDLIAASLIAVFIILALIAMFYTVSFVKAKEKEKCPTITIIESGPQDETRKYTVGSSSKHGSPICYGKIVRSPQQRQLRHKHERMPVQKTESSNLPTDSSNRTTETMSLPPPQMVPICPRPLRSHVSRAYSPRPLTPKSVSSHAQLPSRQQTYSPSPQRPDKHKEGKKRVRREAVQPSYETSRPKTRRKLALQDAESPTLLKDKPSAEYRASLPSIPRRLALQDKGIPLAIRDSTLPHHQTSQLTTLEGVPLQDEGSLVSTRSMEVVPQPESPLTSVPRMSDARLPVPVSDTSLSDYEDPHQATTKQISFYNHSDTRMSDHQTSYQPSISRIPSMGNTPSAISARDATLSRYYPSSPTTPPEDESELAVSARDARYYPSSSIRSLVDNSTLAAKPREVTLPSYPARMHSWNAPLSVSDKLVRNINQDIEQKQLSLSAPNLPVHSARQKVPMQFPYQPAENAQARYPLSMTTTSTKSVSLMPPHETFDTTERGSLERSGRSAFISDEGDIVSTEPYAEPSSTTIRPIRSSQHAVPITHSLPSIPQLSHIRSSRKLVPLSLSYGSLAPRQSSPQPMKQRARSKSISIPVAPLSPYWPNQYTYQGSISARDLHPRMHHIPKRGEVGITSPDIVQSSMYPISPLPQGQNQQPISQSQVEYQLPSLSLSSLSSPYLPEGSIMAYIPSRQQITQDYIPEEVASPNINQGPQCLLIGPGQQPPLPSPTAARDSFIEPSFSYSGVAPFAKEDLPYTDSSHSRIPYSASYIPPTQQLQGWISPSSPAVGEVGISNIPSQGSFANVLQDNLQSGRDLFSPTTAHSPSAYSVSQPSSMMPSYQQVSLISQQGSESDAYSRSQATIHSPLPKVPPPLSPSDHTEPASLQQSSFAFPSFQPLAPLSLTFLRQPAAENSQVVPSESQSSKLQEPFNISRFEDSKFLKGKPMSQSFIFKDYSSPALSTISVAPQSFNLTPRKYSYSDDDVFTYPDGSQHLVSTPKHSRTMSVSVDPEVFQTALESASSISSGSTEEIPFNEQLSLRRMQDSFPASSESVYQVPPSPSQREKYTNMSSDYSINEISSDTNQFPRSPYHSARTFFNDSSDYTNSD